MAGEINLDTNKVYEYENIQPYYKILNDSIVFIIKKWIYRYKV